MEIRDIANKLNSKLRAWIDYYGLYGKAALRRLMIYVDFKLIAWLRNKYKISGVRKAADKLKSVMNARANMFYHWQKGYCYFIKQMARAV
jgi:RNA-directed DNA polymerase